MRIYGTAALLVVCAATSANAAVLTGPITNPANGHEYYLLGQDTWTNSEAEAVTLGGHLVTINDAAENQWVVDMFANFNNVDRFLWIGLNDQVQESEYIWASGESPLYTNWAPGQPDASSLLADVVSMEGPSSIFPLGTWNDANDSALGSLGVVEVVPEPGSLVLLSLGCVALLRRRR